MSFQKKTKQAYAADKQDVLKSPHQPSCPQNPTTCSDNRVPYIVRNCIALFHICASSKFKLKQILAFSMRHGIPLTNLEMGRHLIYTAVSLSVPMTYAHYFCSNPKPRCFHMEYHDYAESENPKPAIELYHHVQLKPDTHVKHILFFDCWIGC
jgi:BRCA1-associated RING domain protein 1